MASRNAGSGWVLSRGREGNGGKWLVPFLSGPYPWSLEIPPAFGSFSLICPKRGREVLPA